jgi:hypothetical protein
MRSCIAVLCAFIGMPAASANDVEHTTIHILSTEPAPGSLKANRTAYVDDGTCPAGQIKMVIGAPDMHTPRQRSCVPR